MAERRGFALCTAPMARILILARKATLHIQIPIGISTYIIGGEAGI